MRKQASGGYPAMSIFAALARAALLLVLFIIAVPAYAAAEKRVALLLGNAAYAHYPALTNPIRDIDAVEERLKQAGFEVIAGRDLGRIETEEIVRRFLKSLVGADVALFYYSGHAVQVNDGNYLVPVDARLASPYDLELETVSIDHLLRYMRERSATQLVFLDACRDNPFVGKSFFVGAQAAPAAPTRGLSRPSAELGSLIAYSTSPGMTATDGVGGMSPFTASLAERMLTPSLEIRQLLTQVRKDVIEATGGKQIPWENSSLIRDFYFVSGDEPPVVATMHRVQVAALGEPGALAIPAPWRQDGGSLSVTIKTLPEQGEAVLDGRVLKLGDRLSPEELTRVAYRPKDGAEGADVLGYEVRDDAGNIAPGLVAITVEEGAAPPPDAAQQPELVLAALTTGLEDAAQAPVEPIIGIGPVPLGLKPSEKAEDLRVRIAAAPPSGRLVLKGRAVATGDMLAAADLGDLAFQPAVGSEAQTLALSLRPVDALGREGPAVSLKLTPKLDPCDVTAGAPLDLQAPGKGVLPNEIEPETAETACLEAVTSYPETHRFLYQLGRVALAKADTGRARELFEIASERGHIRADQSLGTLYLFGGGVARDREKAAALFEKAADKGDPFAMHSLGKQLYRGNGVPQDRERGLALMIQAAEMGHTYAFNELGTIFLEGVGVEPDLERARRYFEASAARNDIYGFNNLGILYRDGKGVPKDPEKALAYFIQANEGGHPNAANNIGRMYFQGDGVEKSVETAAAWYEVSANRGNPFAAMNRAWIAANGPESLRDEAEAAAFYAQAIALDRADEVKEKAQAALGALPEEARWKAAQALLNEAGHPVGEPDGRPGAATRAAIAEFLEKTGGEAAGDGPDDILVALARFKWLASQPRFDLF